MFFKKIESKGLAHFSYMIGDGNQLAVIDPRRDVQIYIDIANRESMTITTILETHRNEDYTIGSIELSEKTNATIYISAHEDLGYVYGEKIYDGDELTIGSLTIRAIHTPGHTLGHMSYAVFEDGRDKAYLVFTGDCLFMGDLGRTDFYGEENLEKMTGLLYDSVVDKLYPLGEHVQVLPAHGFGSACGASVEDRPYTTIGYEKAYNPELQVASRQEFIQKFGRMRIKPRYFEVMEVNNVKGAPFVHHPTSLPPLSMEDIQDRGIHIFDVRAKEAYFGGHIPGSLFLSRNNFSTFAANLVDVSTPVAFIVPKNNMDMLMELYFMARRIGFDHVLGYIPNALDNWQNESNPIEKLSTISAEYYLELNDDSVLLDIRKPEHMSDNDPVRNRINIALEELYKEYVKLPKEKDIYILCASGDRSTTAASFLAIQGIRSIVIEGGIQALNDVAHVTD